MHEFVHLFAFYISGFNGQQQGWAVSWEHLGPLLSTTPSIELISYLFNFVRVEASSLPGSTTKLAGGD